MTANFENNTPITVNILHMNNNNNNIYNYNIFINIETIDNIKEDHNIMVENVEDNSKNEYAEYLVQEEKVLDHKDLLDQDLLDQDLLDQDLLDQDLLDQDILDQDLLDQDLLDQDIIQYYKDYIKQQEQEQQDIDDAMEDFDCLCCICDNPLVDRHFTCSDECEKQYVNIKSIDNYKY